MLDHSQKVFQDQIFIKHYAPYIETHYHSTCLEKVQKEIYCHCLHTHLSMEVHWFAVSKLQVRGQLCYPGHVVSFYQVFTRLNIWSLAKQKFKQMTFMFSRRNTWITTLPLHRFLVFHPEAWLLYQKVSNSPNTTDKLQQATLQLVPLIGTQCQISLQDKALTEEVRI